MNISFKSKKLQEQLMNKDRLKKEYGRLAKPISRLINQIKEMKRHELYRLPDFHELRHQAKGVFASTIKHPYRLVMRVDNSQDLMILAVIDYHGKTNIINF